MSGRIRSVKPEILEDTKTAALDSDSFRLFVGLIVLADDYGNGRASPVWLDGQVFWGHKVSRGSRECLANLAKSGLVRLYSVAGQPYVSITHWDKHQKVDHPGKPRVPSVDLADPENPRETLAKVSRDSRETLATDLRPPTSDQDHDHECQTTVPVVAPSQDVDLVFDVWRATLMPAAKKTGQRIRRIKARFKEGFTADQLCKAAGGASKDPFLMGTDPNSRRGGYRDIETIYRDAAQVERLIRLADNADPVPPPKSNGSRYAPPERDTTKAAAADVARTDDLLAKRGNGKLSPSEHAKAASDAASFLAGFGKAES